MEPQFFCLCKHSFIFVRQLEAFRFYNHSLNNLYLEFTSAGTMYFRYKHPTKQVRCFTWEQANINPEHSPTNQPGIDFVISVPTSSSIVMHSL